jgi:hypothetical protein
MANEMRDRLVEMLYEARKEWDVYFNDCLLKGKPRRKTLNEFIADHLIENGVVPVVRCKNCVHYQNEWCEILKAESPVEDGFCCYGERRCEE